MTEPRTLQVLMTYEPLPDGALELLPADGKRLVAEDGRPVRIVAALPPVDDSPRKMWERGLLTLADRADDLARKASGIDNAFARTVAAMAREMAKEGP